MIGVLHRIAGSMFDRFELVRKQDQVTIQPIGKHNLQVDASCQVLVPFSASASYRPKSTGRLKVAVQGRTKTLEAEVIVVIHGSNQGEENALPGTKSALHR